MENLEPTITDVSKINVTKSNKKRSKKRKRDRRQIEKP